MQFYLYLQITTRYYDSVLMGHATAEDLIEKLLENMRLPLHKNVMVGMDGPPVNLKLQRLLNEHIKVSRQIG